MLTHPTIEEELRELFAGGFDAVRDPYPLWRRLREEAPVFSFDATTVIVSPHALAKQVYRESDRFPNPTERFSQFGESKLRLLSDEEIQLYRQVIDLESAYVSRLNG